MNRLSSAAVAGFIGRARNARNEHLLVLRRRQSGEGRGHTIPFCLLLTLIRQRRTDPLYGDRRSAVVRPDAGVAGFGQRAQTKMVGMSSATNAVEGLDLDPLPPADKLLLEEPGLADRALATLARWRHSTDPCSHSLLDEWHDILIKQEWRRAVAGDERGNALRQASPLGAVLPEGARKAVLAKVQTPLRTERARANGG